MDRSNKKGGDMNQPTTYALGLFHGGLIIGFVWIMFQEYREKVVSPRLSLTRGEERLNPIGMT
jgi:hypothetical protein